MAQPCAFSLQARVKIRNGAVATLKPGAGFLRASMLPRLFDQEVGMELMQLEMLVAAVEEGGIHKAADRVSRTQPAVSMALRKLEAEIGAPLFDRSQRHHYTLTDAGETLYAYAKRLLDLRGEALSALKELNHLERGHLRVGANESVSQYLLPKLTREFHQQYPKIEIEVRQRLSSRLLEEIKQRRLDCAILSFLPHDGAFEATPVVRDELVLIASPQHRLASRQRIRIRDLGAESLIAHQARSPSRDKVAEAFRRSHTAPNVAQETASLEEIKRLIAANVGVGFVPLSCAQEEVERRELVVIPVADFHHERTLWAVRRRTNAHSRAAQAFLQVIVEMAEKLSRSEPRSRLRERGEICAGFYRLREYVFTLFASSWVIDPCICCL
jgi:DNA-binding transcriptional LysR family regulator